MTYRLFGALTPEEYYLPQCQATYKDVDQPGLFADDVAVLA